MLGRRSMADEYKASNLQFHIEPDGRCVARVESVQFLSPSGLARCRRKPSDGAVCLSACVPACMHECAALRMWLLAMSCRHFSRQPCTHDLSKCRPTGTSPWHQ